MKKQFCVLEILFLYVLGNPFSGFSHFQPFFFLQVSQLFFLLPRTTTQKKN